MSWEQPLLLVAIVATFLWWQLARRQTESVRRAEAERLARLTYTLEAHETTNGRGFIIRDADERELGHDSLNWREHGLAAVTMHTAALELVPGAALLLEPAGDGENVDVLLEETGQRSGVLRGAEAAGVREKLAADEVGSALVLWERRNAALPEIAILLVHRDVAMDEGA